MGDGNTKKQTEYTIKLIPSDGGDVKVIHLTKQLLIGAIASVLVGAMLFVGASSYAVYSTFQNQNERADVEQLKEVNRIQQEQLLQLSKRANGLQDELDQLTQMETELRHMSGVAPAEGTADGAANGGDGSANPAQQGQGGPALRPDIENIGQTLDALEKSIAARKASLLQLKEELDAQQKELGALGPIGGLTVNGIANTTPAIWPAHGSVSSPFGLRWGGSDFHPGMDIANDMGTPIVATADGTVTYAGWNSGGYGNMVDIDHGNGIMTRYGHAMQVVVTSGQQVKRGQLIAYMGSTGFSTGPHVHYEVRINGSPVNPIGYFNQ